MSAMSTPQSPGWYPAPDGRGRQWWNGTSWSDARREADGSTTLDGLPGYQAAPPPGGDAASIPPPPPQSRFSVSPGVDGTWITALVFSIVGFVVFNLFSVIALLLAIIGLRGAGPVGRVMCLIAMVISIAGIVSGVISFVQGDRSIGDIIF